MVFAEKLARAFFERVKKYHYDVVWEKAREFKEKKAAASCLIKVQTKIVFFSFFLNSLRFSCVQARITCEVAMNPDCS